MTIPIVLSHVAAQPPKRANLTDAGADLHAVESYVLYPGDRIAVETGLSLAIPPGFYGQIAPRSGLAAKNGVMVLGGVIDSAYRGAVKVLLYNSSHPYPFAEPIRISTGDRIAQLIILPISLAEFSPVESLPDTVRGQGGFGSSGA
jgi:dUTP pyrophosphatase